MYATPRSMEFLPKQGKFGVAPRFCIPGEVLEFHAAEFYNCLVIGGSMSSSNPQSDPNQAVQNVKEARQLLQSMREELDRHPKLEEAIVKLELALESLTLKTGGML